MVKSGHVGSRKFAPLAKKFHLSTLVNFFPSFTSLAVQFWYRVMATKRDFIRIQFFFICLFLTKISRMCSLRKHNNLIQIVNSGFYLLT